MEPGTYCLVFSNRARTLSVGALGTVSFRAGYHLYIGSALGPGGLARVERHLRLARTRIGVPRWHVDHLLLDPGFRVVAVVTGTGTGRLECRLARTIGGESIPRFGASDCRCGSHLLYRRRNPEPEIAAAFATVGLVPSIRRGP
ncbi:MAG TPA: DUF123 domain-containing protein [Methanoregulaceae archaeon]|nr:DUF123 domain-containing protein [Methanoregulaceae archaeon]